MIEINSPSLSKRITTDRIIGQIDGNQPGPTLVFIGGLHGNEPTGVFALHRVFRELEARNCHVNGKLVALAGNLKALVARERFIDEDLNRLWSQDVLDQLAAQGPGGDAPAEWEEMAELRAIINDVLDNADGPCYFIDLHTTSSMGEPFVFMTHTQHNLDYAKNFPLPTIVGIDDHIHGALLSLISERGHVSLAFEGGQHDELLSYQHHLDFIWLSLVLTGCIPEEELPEYKQHYSRLHRDSEDAHKVFHILHRHGIAPEDAFEMKPGYTNFQPIRKNEVLAWDQRGEIRSENSGRIFMPLYQDQGEDGFFVIEEVAKVNGHDKALSGPAEVVEG